MATAKARIRASGYARASIEKRNWTILDSIPTEN